MSGLDRGSTPHVVPPALAAHVSMPPGRRAAVSRRQLLAGGGGLGVTALLPSMAGAPDAAPAGTGRAAGADGYVWQNVAIGGGGYVTGIVIHPRVPGVVYVRTDVGGAFRWDPAHERWKAVTDVFSFEERNLYGIESIAVDPEDASTLYIAAGQGNRGGTSISPQDVLRSTDGGATWVRTGLPVGMWGNGDYRWAGERLAVDPHDRDVLYFGSRADGLWRSTNAARTWQRVTTFPTTGQLWGGLAFVLFGRGPGRPGEPTREIYVGAWGAGVFRSTDAGRTWTLLEGGPLRPVRAAVAADGTVYVSHTAGVASYTRRGWVDVTPEPGTEYSGVTVDPHDPRRVIVAARAATFLNPLYQSTNGGRSWTRIEYVAESDVDWWPDRFFASATASVLIDPHEPRRVWLTDWFGIWRTDDVRRTPSHWYTRQLGHEETVVFTLVSPPRGVPLLSGVADVSGFRHPSLTRFPTEADHVSTGLQDVVTYDFCEADPRFVVAVGRDRDTTDPGGFFSTDNARTWTAFPALPTPEARDGRIAVSARDRRRLVWMPINASPYATRDGGATWQASTGAPAVTDISHDVWAPNQPLAADRVDGSFYLYAYRTGAFYRSDDDGATWREVARLPSLPTVYERHFVKAAPGSAGEVWVSLDNQGLFRSTDGGATFTRIDAVQRSFLFALGASRPGTRHPTLFVFGTVGGVKGIFRSDDLGRRWVRIDTFPVPTIGANVRVMEGDRRVFGRVYVGTGGRGIYYGEPG